MNNIKKLIEGLESEVFRFKPNSSFYAKVNIKRKRFFQLYRNEKSATIEEMKAIANYFDVPLDKLINY